MKKSWFIKLGVVTVIAKCNNAKCNKLTVQRQDKISTFKRKRMSYTIPNLERMGDGKTVEGVEGGKASIRERRQGN